MIGMATRIGRARLSRSLGFLLGRICGYSSATTLSMASTDKHSISQDKTSEIFKKLTVSPIKALYKYYTPTAVNLAGGLPLESCFPFSGMDVYLRDTNKDGTNSFSMKLGENLHMNYHRGSGIPQLRDWAHRHMQEIHGRPGSSFDLTLTIGSTDAWSKIVNMLAGDCILFDQYVYGASVATCEAVGKTAVGVTGDAGGMCPQALRNTVKQLRDRGQSVHVLYIVPTGHNPLGVTLSDQRKRDLYQVCQELDLVIVEDDAYYYLYFPEGQEESQCPGLRGLPLSFFSLDQPGTAASAANSTPSGGTGGVGGGTGGGDGRVVRIDSLSKFIAPGTRVGWAAGPADFIEKYVLLQEISSQFPSGASQSMLLGLFSHWGEHGFHTHLQKLQSHYARQREVLTSTLLRFFPPGVCSFSAPTGGMFVWLEFPALAAKGVTTFQLFEALAAQDVIAAPGTSFFVPGVSDGKHRDGASSSDAAGKVALRVCFASAPTDKMELAVERMAAVVLQLLQ